MSGHLSACGTCLCRLGDGLEVAVVVEDGPGDASDLVCEGDGGDLGARDLLDLERPGATAKWHDILTPRNTDGTALGLYRVSKKLLLPDKATPANVVFRPARRNRPCVRRRGCRQGGGRRPGVGTPALSRDPCVRSSTTSIGWRARRRRGSAPVRDLLVRVPSLVTSFANSPYRVLAHEYEPVSESCVYLSDSGNPECEAKCGPNKDQVCTLEGQFFDLDTMEQPPYSPDPKPAFAYADPERCVGEWNSENTGDIVMLADMEAQYYFDKEKQGSTHGSLTYADAIIPLAFSYPGATSADRKEDTLLAPVRSFLETAVPADNAAFSPVEEQAMERPSGCGRKA